MALSFFKWSRTASSNATADPSVNWAEGQAPSSVNDSARAMMASAAGFRDDISGAITTGGTSTAYTVTSYQVFDSLANMNGQMIAFVPHTTNGATVTLNVDGLGAKPLRPAPSLELQTGALIQGTPYVATYNNSDAVWYLHGTAGYNSYSLPLGAGFHYWGTTAPNSAFAFAYGQAISRTTYATLFSLVGTTFGTGDGSTTFNMPDVRGRIVAGKDDMGGSAASRLTSTYFGTSAAALGATGGSQNHTLAQAELPNVSFTVSGNTSSGQVVKSTSGSLVGVGSGSFASGIASGAGSVGDSSISGTAASGGSGTPLAIIQPTIIANYIIRVI